MSERAGKTPDLSKAAATPHAVAEPKQHAQSDKDGSRAILKLQRAAGNAAVQVLLGTGMPLPSTVRGEMESRFGADFGGVRIHDDKQAHTAAARHEATAFTYGKDIFFGADRFAPDSVEGRRLLAHELAHVIQQRRGGAAPTGDANESTEQAAKQAAAAFSDGHGRIDVVGATSVGIAREEDDKRQRQPKTLAEYEDRFGKIDRIADEDLNKEQRAKKAKVKRESRIGRISTPEDRAARWEQDKAAVGISSEDPTPINTRLRTEQGRQDRQGALRRLAFETDPKVIPPQVAADLRNQLKRMEQLMAEGRYDEDRHRLRLADGYVVGHWEGDDFVADTPYTPAREGFDYNNSRVITVKENRREDARRRENDSKVARTSIKESKEAPTAVAPKIRKKEDKGGTAPMPKPALERPTKATEEPSVSVQPVGGKTIALEERSVAAISQTLEKSASSSAGKAVVADAAAASKSIAKTASQAAPLAGELKEPAPGRPRIGGGPSLASAVHGEAQIQAAQNKGAALGIAAGLLAGFALDKYREWMRESLAAMPPIEIGREPLGEYLKSSPAAMNMIGLLAKDINGFAANVEKTSQTVLYNAAGRTLAIRLSQYSRARRIELLRQVDESVGAFWGELVQARAGIEGALALESQGQQTIAAATDLAEMILKPSPTIGNAMVWDFLVKQGFLIEEIMQMHGNLESYARAIRGLFRRLHDLHDLIEGTIREVGSFGSELNRLWWAEVLTQAREQGAESNSP